MAQQPKPSQSATTPAANPTVVEGVKELTLTMGSLKLLLKQGVRFPDARVQVLFTLEELGGKLPPAYEPVKDALEASFVRFVRTGAHRSSHEAYNPFED